MSKAVLVARILLGLLFTVFDLNGFLNFLPAPEIPEGAMAFMGGLGSTGYFFPLLKITEIFGGLCLLTGMFVPLGLILLAPIIVNIAAYHLFLDQAGLPMVFGIVAMEILVAWGYRDSFTSVLNRSAKPTGS